MKKIFTGLTAFALLPFFIACSNNDSPKLVLDIEEISATADGGHFRVTVSSSSATKSHIEYPEAGSDWVHLLPSYLSGDGILEVTVDSYDYVLADRTAEIQVVGDELTQSVKITQHAKPGLSLGKKIILAVDEARDYTVSVASSSSWTASVPADASWITLSKGSGEQGEGELTFSLSAIDYSARRDAVITVTGDDGLSEEVKVSQGYGVQFGSKLWAKCDVGDPDQFTASPEIKGLLYQYDKKVGYPSIKDDATTPAGFDTGAYAGGDDWQEENDPCPDGWRVPTEAETIALLGAKGGANGQPSSKIKWGWWRAEQGAYVGTDQASSANPDDPKGCIFLPMSGYRTWEDGHENYYSSTFIQTRTRPGHNWGRYYFQVHWNDMVFEFSNENNCAFPVRCIADFD